MISEDEVKKIAFLARLTLEPDFIPIVTGHLNSIFGYMERLNAVDTTGIEPTSHALGANNVFRADVVTPTDPPANVDSVPLNDATPALHGCLDVQALLSNAPDVSGRFVRVPIIIE